MIVCSFKCLCILNIIFFVSFANMRVSALSLNKKQSSAYSKYACGCFLYAPSIYSAYLQKANGKAFFEKSGSAAAWMPLVLAAAMFCRMAKLVFSDRHGRLSKNTFQCRRMYRLHLLPVHQDGRLSSVVPCTSFTRIY